jgi:adenine-specific DNA-methyltransferase
MPELHFKGKEYVYNHHLTVPYRPLVAHPGKSMGDETENLIIHGDNLHALKALLPLGVEYAPLPFALYRFREGVTP